MVVVRHDGLRRRRRCGSSLPPMTSGMSTVSPAMLDSRALIEARSGEPGA